MHERRQTRAARWWPALAVASVVAGVWVNLVGSEPPAAPVVRPVRPVLAAPPPSAARHLTVQVPVVLRAAPAVAAAPRAPAIGRAEVCGYGMVELPPDDPDPAQRIPAALRQSALDAMDTRMLASDDVQVRAAGLWMGARLRGRDVQGRIEQIVRLAIASPDPFVYALALESCKLRSAADGGSCRLLSPAQWVRLDPDNAVPWQALAAEAHASDEPQAEDLALQLAARAPRSDVHAGRLLGLVQKALGQGLSPLQRTLALNASLSAEAVWSASHGVAVMHSPQGEDLSCEGVRRRVAMATP